MTVIDISRVLKTGTAVWPGDTPYHLKQVLKMSDGDSVNLTTLQMSAHTGSHVDAPIHFTESGASIDELELVRFWGKAQVVSVQKERGPLVPEDFEGFDLAIAPRILVRSKSSDLDQGIFPDIFVYPSPSLADELYRAGIVLYGTDAPSVDDMETETLEAHRALNRKGIAILEWLDLSQVEDGIYDLVALPLRIDGGDGSPVRAALRKREDLAR